MDFKTSAIRKALQFYRADALLLVSVINRQWYTGSWSDFGFVLVIKTKSYVCIDARDYETTKQHVKHAQIMLYRDFAQWQAFVKSLKIKTLLIENDELTLTQFTNLVKPLTNIKFKPIDASNLRIVKTPQEIASITTAAKIACDGVNHLRKWLTPGVSEIQAANELLAFMVKRGASGGSFNFIVAFGDNSAKPHSVPTKRKLKANDIVLVDCGCIYNGYCSDITRTWFWGKATKQLTAMYQAVLAGNKIGIKHAHGNIIGQALDKIVRDTVKQNWGENYDIPHGVGHGVGLAIHESPRVNKIYNLPLPINSVVTIEPGIYIPNIGGIRIEDLIVITKTGCKVLTKSCPK